MYLSFLHMVPAFTVLIIKLHTTEIPSLSFESLELNKPLYIAPTYTGYRLPGGASCLGCRRFDEGTQAQAQ